jgi:hypothetical protein
MMMKRSLLLLISTPSIFFVLPPIANATVVTLIPIQIVQTRDGAMTALADESIIGSSVVYSQLFSISLVFTLFLHSVAPAARKRDSTRLGRQVL